MPPISFAIIWEVLGSAVSSVKMTLRLSCLALLITFSKVLAVGSACDADEGIIVFCVRSYSSAKYEKALWNTIKSNKTRWYILYLY